ncbi:MAG: hypothetical protein ACRD5F_05965 [Candidatus Acidiferrales bacterium]
MSRVPQSAHYGWFTRLIFWGRQAQARPRANAVACRGTAPVHRGVATMFGVQEAAKSVEPGLKSLARIQVARLVGCPF